MGGGYDNIMKPIYIPENCIFNLRGSKEKIKDYRLDRYYGSVKVNDNGVLETDTATASAVYILKKARTFDNNAWSLSFFAKRKVNTNEYQEFGFGFGYSMNFGYANDAYQQYSTNCVYIDDGSGAAVWARAITEIDPSIDQESWIFYTICVDTDGKIYFSVNGKQFTMRDTAGNILDKFGGGYNFGRITLFSADGATYSAIYQIDNVIIHRGVCLYKTDFECPVYTPPTLMIPDELKLY